MKKPLFITSLLILLVGYTLKGQPAPAKFGKVDMADLEMKTYPLDTTAKAVILCDFGEFNTSTFEFTRLLRIKVLKKEGSDLVNQTLYIDGKGAIKGCTYNLVNGEVVESKLKNTSIFEEMIREDNYRYRITMPDVQVGSVVDIQYSFPLLPQEWRFQDEIPVRWSELRINYSTYVSFQKVFYGFLPLYINEPNRWVGKDMPALRDEPYTNSITNYLTKFEIELSDITIPGYYRFYTSSWDAVNKYLDENKYFGETMSAGLFLSNDVKAIEAKNLTGTDKMKAACDIIKQKVKWNEDESLYTSTSDLSMSYKKGSGNSADINLILVQLLKKLDFDAFPVALSTRENGIISLAYPTIDKFNYVIAGVKFNNKYYLFDATETYLPSGMLPFRALNGRGRTISTKLSEWVDLAPEFSRKKRSYTAP